jgi:AraC family transcriptional regulator of arabinose operon
MNVTVLGCNGIHPSDFVMDCPNGFHSNLLLLIKTAALLSFGKEQIHIQPNSAILLQKKKPFVYRACERYYIDDWMHLDFEESELKDLNFPLNIPIQYNSTEEVNSLFRFIYDEFYLSGFSKEKLIDHMLKALLIKLSDEYLKNSNPTQLTLFIRLREQIYGEPMKDWKISDAANRIHLSVSYFQNQYKKFFGVSIGSDIILSRIIYAKNLLSSTTMNVKQIAFQCGYHNVEHFSRQFKQMVGSTPLEYRQCTED